MGYKPDQSRGKKGPHSVSERKVVRDTSGGKAFQSRPRKDHVPDQGRTSRYQMPCLHHPRGCSKHNPTISTRSTRHRFLPQTTPFPSPLPSPLRSSQTNSPVGQGSDSQAETSLKICSSLEQGKAQQLPRAERRTPQPS